jgi:hypothetical protein
VQLDHVTKMQHLWDPTGWDLMNMMYELGGELRHDEFDVTYIYTEAVVSAFSSGPNLSCPKCIGGERRCNSYPKCTLGWTLKKIV